MRKSADAVRNDMKPLINWHLVDDSGGVDVNLWVAQDGNLVANHGIKTKTHQIFAGTVSSLCHSSNPTSAHRGDGKTSEESTRDSGVGYTTLQITYFAI